MQKKHLSIKLVVLALTLVSLFYGCSTPAPQAKSTKIDLTQQKWIGRCISYSGYRNGQHPDKSLYPTQDQVLQDLKILEKNWVAIRMYGADQHTKDVLEVIRRENLKLKVMLGMWLDGAPADPGDNEKQIQTGIQLANEYKDIVIAVNAGNEVLVHWSDHKLSEDYVIETVKRVKEAIEQPVTVADDFLFWREHGKRLAKEVDFVTMHTYPMWGKQDIDTAMPVTIEHFNSVRDSLPGKTIVIGEAGWATYAVGELHAPRAGDETKQISYFNDLMAWSKENNVNVFFFEAFDEPWKGSGTEGHWGVFTEDRKAKPVMQEWYPELMPEGPTSPSYDDVE